MFDATDSSRGKPPRPARGFSLPELLVVLAIMGLALTVAVPLVAEQIRLAAIRGAADQFTVDLKAARMIAVSKRAPVDVTVATSPANSYQYVRTDGTLRVITMPSQVSIVSSTSPIQFLPTGGLSSTTPATTVIEAALPGGGVERWTVTTSILGVAKSVRQRVSS